MKRYLSGWNLGRILRLILGIIILIQGVEAQQWVLVILGFMFALMAVLNSGCCNSIGVVGCKPTRTSDRNTSIQDIKYEQIK